MRLLHLTRIQRSNAWLAHEAIQRHLDLEAWQVGEIGKALAEADSGDFATNDEIAAVRARYVG